MSNLENIYRCTRTNRKTSLLSINSPHRSGDCAYRSRDWPRRYYHRVDVRGGLWLFPTMAADPHCLYGDHVYVDDLSYLHAHRDAVNRGDTSLLR